MEPHTGRIYNLIGRRLKGRGTAEAPETIAGCVYKGKMEWSAEGEKERQLTDALWSRR